MEDGRNPTKTAWAPERTKKKKSENELQITANELNKVVSCMV